MKDQFPFSRRGRDEFGKYGSPSGTVGKCHCDCSYKEDDSKWHIHDGGHTVDAVLHFEIQFLSPNYYPIQTGTMSMRFWSPGDNQPGIKNIYPRSGFEGRPIQTSFIQHNDKEPEVGITAGSMATLNVKGMGKTTTTKGRVEQSWQFSSIPSSSTGVIWMYQPVSTDLSVDHHRPFHTAIYLEQSPADQGLNMTVQPHIKPLLRRDTLRLYFSFKDPVSINHIVRGPNCGKDVFTSFLDQLPQDIDRRNMDLGALSTILSS